MTASETVLLNISSIMDLVDSDERYSLSQENGYTFNCKRGSLSMDDSIELGFRISALKGKILSFEKNILHL